MHQKPGHGLSRAQLEYELSWQLRRVPSDPAKLVEFLGSVMVILIEKNNAALAQKTAHEAPVDPPAVH
ncbi:MAG: hypothetical protein ACRDGQ_03960 [Candidatus Limnocylindrales bacterium]